jgi:hypothetical protein
MEFTTKFLHINSRMRGRWARGVSTPQQEKFEKYFSTSSSTRGNF